MMKRQKQQQQQNQQPTIDLQLEGAFLFMFRDLVGENHSVGPCIVLSGSADDEEVTFVFYSVVILHKSLAVFQPVNISKEILKQIAGETFNLRGASKPYRGEPADVPLQVGIGVGRVPDGDLCGCLIAHVHFPHLWPLFCHINEGHFCRNKQMSRVLPFYCNQPHRSIYGEYQLSTQLQNVQCLVLHCVLIFYVKDEHKAAHNCKAGKNEQYIFLQNSWNKKI